MRVLWNSFEIYFISLDFTTSMQLFQKAGADTLHLLLWAPHWSKRNRLVKQEKVKRAEKHESKEEKLTEANNESKEK